MAELASFIVSCIYYKMARGKSGKNTSKRTVTSSQQVKKKVSGAIRRPALHPLPSLHHQQWFLEMPRERGVIHTLSQAHLHQHQNRRRRDLSKRVSLKVEIQRRMTHTMSRMDAMMVQVDISGLFFSLFISQSSFYSPGT